MLRNITVGNFVNGGVGEYACCKLPGTAAKLTAMTAIMRKMIATRSDNLN